jgi:outer membrane protein OmpA-like peptidoglycan-associated protein
VKVNGKWQPSRQLTKNVNTENHDAAAGLSPDGSKLYVYRHSGNDGGDLYESILFGLDWEAPVHMNKNINTKYHESSVSLSFDGRRLYFVSDKESGHGDRDIYYSDMDLSGEWGPSKNLGPEINTKYAEESVFMHPDGVTMYFSSKGHNSMGGHDIFKTTLVNNRWTTPVNLGYPINGPDDDVFFVVSGSGNRAYFASAKQGGYGEKDLYKITFLGPEKQPLLNSLDQLFALVADPVINLKTESAIEVKSSKLTILKGVVSDEKTELPLEALIELIDNEKNVILATFKSNSSTGKYLVTLPSGKNYGLAVKCEGYLFHSENFNIPEAAEFQEFNLDIEMKKVEIGSTIVLRNIFFDFDKATLKPESENELNRLVKLLKDNPTVNIELSSHTDNLGSSEYNLKLSDSRSKSVVEYLVAKGISNSRLVAKGYGESKPLDKNDTEAGRQNNRRTEFKILSK